MINVALPKGRLGERAYEAFASAGYDCPAILEKNRRLTFENREKGVRYFWVKPSDVSIYVERGAADVGIAGGKGEGLVFRRGKILYKVPEDKLVDALMNEIEKL